MGIIVSGQLPGLGVSVKTEGQPGEWWDDLPGVWGVIRV